MYTDPSIKAWQSGHYAAPGHDPRNVDMETSSGADVEKKGIYGGAVGQHQEFANGTTANGMHHPGRESPASNTMTAKSEAV